MLLVLAAYERMTAGVYVFTLARTPLAARLINSHSDRVFENPRENRIGLRSYVTHAPTEGK